MNDTTHRLTVGDRVPPFAVESTAGKSISLGDMVGKPLVMVFASAREAGPVVVNGFAARADDFQSLGVNLLCLSADPVSLRSACNLPDLPVGGDPGGRVASVYGVVSSDQAEGACTVFLIDSNARVVEIYDAAGAELATQVLADARKLFQEEPRHVPMQAPVLIIPRVFDADFCRHLIGIWETEGNVDSGFMRQIDGRTVGLLDYSHKIRRDHFLKEGETRTRINQIVHDRVRPEILKAFQFDITRFEDFRIACYDSSRGGYFRPHRDNSTDGTAHRRFAMTLNLNAGEYEGGYLRFPEYGLNKYRPDTGSAVVFSCSLLHEATEVTAGRRFVLLSFFYGEREAQLREAYNRRTGGEYRAFVPNAPRGVSGQRGQTSVIERQQSGSAIGT